jgi:hypothetical protein
MKHNIYLLIFSVFCFLSCKDLEEQLNPPVAKDATGIHAKGFTANWEAYHGVKHFLLYVSEEPDFKAYLPGYEGKEVKGQSHQVEGLKPERTYYYKVRASIHGQLSGFSDVIKVTTSESLYKIEKLVYRYTDADNPEQNKEVGLILYYYDGQALGVSDSEFRPRYLYRFDEKNRIKIVVDDGSYPPDTRDVFLYDEEGKVIWRYPFLLYRYSDSGRKFEAGNHYDSGNSAYYLYERDEDGNIVYHKREISYAPSEEIWFTYNDLEFPQNLDLILNESVDLIYLPNRSDAFGLPEAYFPIWIDQKFNVQKQVIKRENRDGKKITEQISYEYEVNEHGLPTYRKATSDLNGDMVELYFHYSKNPGQNNVAQ